MKGCLSISLLAQYELSNSSLALYPGWPEYEAKLIPGFLITCSKQKEEGVEARMEAMEAMSLHATLLVSFLDLGLLRRSLGMRLLIAHFWTPPLLLSMTLW